MDKVERQYPKTLLELAESRSGEDGVFINKAEAMELGTNEAIVLSMLRNYIAGHAAKRSGKHCVDGQWWNYCSSRKLANEIGFLSHLQIFRAFTSLVERGVLKRRNDLNTHDYDRTYWYNIPGFLTGEVPREWIKSGANGKASQNGSANGKAEGVSIKTMSLLRQGPEEGGVSKSHNGCFKMKQGCFTSETGGVSKRNDDTHVVQDPCIKTLGSKTKEKIKNKKKFRIFQILKTRNRMLEVPTKI